MRTAHWGDNAWPIADDNLSTDQVKESFTHIDPAIEDAVARLDGDHIHFELPVAQKG